MEMESRLLWNHRSELVSETFNSSASDNKTYLRLRSYLTLSELIGKHSVGAIENAERAWTRPRFVQREKPIILSAEEAFRLSFCPAHQIVSEVLGAVVRAVARCIRQTGITPAEAGPEASGQVDHNLQRHRLKPSLI